MQKAILTVLAGLAMTASGAATIPDWAYRVQCELQAAGAQSLPPITILQGTTPLFAFEQYRAGRSVAADTEATAKLVFSSDQQAEHWVRVESYETAGNAYLAQCPSIGTNSAGQAWWYTVYFEKEGKRYWTGAGRLRIEATTSNEDGLHWQEIASGKEQDPVAIPLLATHTNDAAIHLTSEQAQKIEASITTIPPETDPVALPLLAAHTNDTAIHLTAEQAERIAAAVTNEPSRIASTNQIIDADGNVYAITHMEVLDTNVLVTAVSYDNNPRFPLPPVGSLWRFSEDSMWRWEQHWMDGAWADVPGYVSDGIYAYDEPYVIYYKPGQWQGGVTDWHFSRPPTSDEMNNYEWGFRPGNHFDLDDDSWIELSYATKIIATTQLVDRVALGSELGSGDYVSRFGGTATNLTTGGWMQLPQTEADTNVTVRLWTSNNVIIAEEVYK